MMKQKTLSAQHSKFKGLPDPSLGISSNPSSPTTSVSAFGNIRGPEDWKWRRVTWGARCLERGSVLPIHGRCFPSWSRGKWKKSFKNCKDLWFQHERKLLVFHFSAGFCLASWLSDLPCTTWIGKREVRKIECGTVFLRRVPRYPHQCPVPTMYGDVSYNCP